MKDYLWEVVKNTCMIIAGVFILALYGIGLVLSVCIALLPLVCSNVSKRLYGI